MFVTILICIIIALSIYLYLVKNNLSNIESFENDLKNCENRFKMLFDIAPVFINSFDDKEVCTYWNKECDKVFRELNPLTKDGNTITTSCANIHLPKGSAKIVTP